VNSLKPTESDFAKNFAERGANHLERGLYAAASGMISNQAMQETLANNIANATTVGYKQENDTFSAVQGMVLNRLQDGQGNGPEIGELGMGVRLSGTYTDWQQGPLAQTGRMLDASLGDNQFFAVQTAQGVRYTRAGNFQIDGQGNLTTDSGKAILGESGQPINVGKATEVAIDGRGNLLANRQIVGKLGIAEADTRFLLKAGDNLFEASNPNAIRTAANPVVRPGTLEQSNMNIVLGMVRLLTTSRSFEMSQKAVATQDELLRQAATEVGKV